jgi:hypothetical protein
MLLRGIRQISGAMRGTFASFVRFKRWVKWIRGCRTAFSMLKAAGTRVTELSTTATPAPYLKKSRQ